MPGRLGDDDSGALPGHGRRWRFPLHDVTDDRRVAGRVAFAVGVFAWLLGDALIALFHPDRTQVAPFLTYFALVGPGGGVAFTVIGLVTQELLLRHVLQPTSPPLTFVLTALIPSLFNGLFRATLVQGIGWARTHARPLFWALVLGLGAYWALLLGLAFATAQA